MIEISYYTLLACGICYIIMFISLIILTNKYFKYKTKYLLLKSGIESYEFYEFLKKL